MMGTGTEATDTIVMRGGSTGRAVRAHLPPAVRAKLEALEDVARAAHAHLMAHGDRIDETRQELVELDRQIEEYRQNPSRRPGRWLPDRAAGPNAQSWHPAATDESLAADRGAVAAELDRLTREGEALQARWSDAGRLADACRQHLGVK